MSVLGIDLDGCIYDFAGHLRTYILATTDRTLESLPTPTQFTLGEVWGYTKDEFVALCDEAVDAGHLFAVGEPEVNGPEVLRALHDEGHRIHIVTARDFGTRSAANTEAWLHAYGIPFDDLTFTSQKHRIICDVYLDDRPEHYVECLETTFLNGGSVYLYDQAWNRQFLAHRILDWEHFGVEVRSL